MFCQISQRIFSEFSATLDNAAIRRHIPLVGALELTYRCNQACCHCYCNLGVRDKKADDELTTAEVIRILDEAADAGCFWLLLTGGEVLLRGDFSDIYLHAVKKGMIVGVFTNGTLIDDRIAGLLAEFPPLVVDISIYGSRPLVHDAITRVKGSFESMMAGVARLKKRGVKLSLKTIAMTPNFQDLGNIHALVKDIGLQFHFDGLISPRIDGGRGPESYRLDVETMTGADIAEYDDPGNCEEVFDEFWNKKPEEPASCGAGVFGFNINPYGILSPCTMFKSFQYSLRAAGFRDSWARLVAEYDGKKKDFTPAECRDCSMVYLCPQCAAWSETETGRMNDRVDYLCNYAKRFEEAFFAKKGGREIWEKKRIKSPR